MNGRPQTGIVGCASVADYENNIIKKHENTLAAKEADRIRHIDTTNMQTGPIFLAFRSNKEIDAFLAQKTSEKPYYDFISEDGITHKVWLVDDDGEIESVELFCSNECNIHCGRTSQMRICLQGISQAPYRGKSAGV